MRIKEKLIDLTMFIYFLPALIRTLWKNARKRDDIFKNEEDLFIQVLASLGIAIATNEQLLSQDANLLEYYLKALLEFKKRNLTQLEKI